MAWLATETRATLWHWRIPFPEFANTISERHSKRRTLEPKGAHPGNADEGVIGYDKPAARRNSWIEHLT
jgi:hypothetical protein